MSSLFEPNSETHGRQTIEALARLHAHFWNDERFDDELSWIRPAMRGPFGARLIDSAREQFGDDQPPVFTELCELYVEHHEAITDLSTRASRRWSTVTRTPGTTSSRATTSASTTGR